MLLTFHSRLSLWTSGSYFFWQHVKIKVFKTFCCPCCDLFERNCLLNFYFRTLSLYVELMRLLSIKYKNYFQILFLKVALWEMLFYGNVFNVRSMKFKLQLPYNYHNSPADPVQTALHLNLKCSNSVIANFFLVYLFYYIYQFSKA